MTLPVKSSCGNGINCGGGIDNPCFQPDDEPSPQNPPTDSKVQTVAQAALTNPPVSVHSPSLRKLLGM